jgi:hypothetical protein
MPIDKNQRYLRGSLITLRRRCGKPGCRCAGKGGIPHESPVISCAIDGKSHVITRVPADVPLVAAALRSYHAEQARLEKACSDGIGWLRGRVDQRRAKRSAS